MIQLLGERVLVALPPKDQIEAQDAATGYTYRTGGATASGLVLAKPTDRYDVETTTRGIVVQLGRKKATITLDAAEDAIMRFFDDLAKAKLNYELPARQVCNGILNTFEQLAPAPFDVQVGDCVVFAPSAGNQFQLADVTYVILTESEILGVVEPTKERVDEAVAAPV